MNEDKIIEAILDLKEGQETIKREIIAEISKHFLTRDEYLTGQDMVMKKLIRIEDEVTLSAYRLRNHEDRIETLETATPRLRTKLA